MGAIMSKRKILRAAAKKGLAFAVCDYDYAATPGGMVGGWSIQLDEASIERIEALGTEYDWSEPDCANANEVLDWIESLPVEASQQGGDNAE